MWTNFTFLIPFVYSTFELTQGIERKKNWFDNFERPSSKCGYVANWWDSTEWANEQWPEESFCTTLIRNDPSPQS